MVFEENQTNEDFGDDCYFYSDGVQTLFGVDIEMNEDLEDDCYNYSNGVQTPFGVDIETNENLGDDFNNYSDGVQTSIDAPIEMNDGLRDDCYNYSDRVQTPISVNIENSSSDQVPTEFCPKPFVGMEFESVKASEEFWKKYGYETGFGGRIKWTNTRKKDNVVTSRLYVCSKQGTKAEDKRRLNSKPRFETRCYCDVLMNIKHNSKNGLYYVTKFFGEHNHELEGKETINLFRAHQSINATQAHTIDVAIRAGLGPTLAHRFMTVEAGGSENLTFNKERLKSHQRIKRVRKTDLGEASTILEYFQTESKKNPGFFHAYQLDCAGQITNFFWADPKMLADYEIFGDMIAFDTTFGTNKESRPLGIFSGFNNNRQIVVFGGSLLYDESAPSFEWLIEKFIYCHGGKKPRIIFTDQYAAMKAAISKKWPTVRHALCTWHIGKNAMENLRKELPGKFSLFMKQFNRCVYSVVDIDEFTVNWRNMVENFGLQGNPWLQGMYAKRHQFCIPFMMDTFTAGTRSTQVCESINSWLKKIIGSGLTMESFFNGFDLFLAEVRRNEREMDCISRQKFPHLSNKYSSILRQAASTYTPRIFKLFNDQFALALVVRLGRHDVLDYPNVIMATEGGRSYKINYDLSSTTISCACCRYEMHGYLCAHILKVFIVFDVERIPDKYIMKRWTVNAKSYNKEVANSSLNLTNAQMMDEVNSVASRLAYRIDGHPDLFKGVLEIINNAHTFIDEKLLSKRKDEEDNSPSFENVNGSGEIAVTGLKKKVSRKGVGKKRGVSWTEGDKSSKKARALQQKKYRLQVVEGQIHGDEELTRLTI